MTSKIRNERILVPVANPATMQHLITIALSIRNRNKHIPVYAAHIVDDKMDSNEPLIFLKENLKRVLSECTIPHHNLKLIVRSDTNITEGIQIIVKEYQITQLVMGWSYRNTAGQLFFGPIFDNLYDHLKIHLLACNLNADINTYRSIHICFPLDIEKEEGFEDYLDTIFHLPFHPGSSFYLILTKDTSAYFELYRKNREFTFSYQSQVYNDLAGFSNYLYNLREGLPVLFYPRRLNKSYNQQTETLLKGFIYRGTKQNFILVVPGEGMAAG